ncbi:hypothetical protein ACRAWG_24870 [Methylobacterium sp. P31]
MTAPQTVATIFFLISIGSALTLALMTAASAALGTVADSYGRTRSSEYDGRPNPFSLAVCRMHQVALDRMNVR